MFQCGAQCSRVPDHPSIPTSKAHFKNDIGTSPFLLFQQIRWFCVLGLVFQGGYSPCGHEYHLCQHVFQWAGRQFPGEFRRRSGWHGHKGGSPSWKWEIFWKDHLKSLDEIGFGSLGSILSQSFSSLCFFITRAFQRSVLLNSFGSFLWSQEPWERSRCWSWHAWGASSGCWSSRFFRRFGTVWNSADILDLAEKTDGIQRLNEAVLCVMNHK